MKKTGLILFLVALIAAFFAFDLDHWLTFEALKQSQARFAALLAESPWQVAGSFFAIYVIVTALSLPGAAIMTLAAGALFGLATGTVLVSFASSIGATLAFLVSRYLLRDAVQQRFGDKLKAINDGIARDGAFYLFTLRLVPLFPFFLINLVMGLTPLRTATFYWVSQVGMLAGTLVYVNAGTQLAQLESPSGILSPELLLSFALLGIFPLIARSVVRRIQRRRVYAKWQRPKTYDRNLIVIGAGAAGLVSAYIAAAVKAKVTLIEAHKMGGDCLNYGCVPSKALIKSAKLAQQIRDADHYGLESGEPTFSFRKVMARVHAVIRAVEPHDSIERYTKLGVEVLQGYARVIDPWTVEIKLNDGGTQRLTTRSIVIATGARPFVPPLPGIEDIGYLTSDTLWEEFAKLDQPPARLVVLGGGPIGCELAQSFARLGSQVTQIQRGPRIMPNEDQEVSAHAKSALEASGVKVLTGHEAVRCERAGERKFIVIKQNDIEHRIEFDALLCAVGRVARLSGYGLEELGIETERTVVTNDYLETLYPNILAAGDVAGPYQFTHIAAHQAWYAAVNALFGDLKRSKADYSVIPWSTFIDPEVARVGLNEQEAKAKGIAYEVTKYGIDDLDRAIADGTAHGFVKVLTVPGKDRILGVTIVGEHAGDLLAEFVLAMKHGLGLNKILGTIHIYPTLAEANKYAAGEWKRAHAPQRVLAWLARYHTWKRGKVMRRFLFALLLLSQTLIAQAATFDHSGWDALLKKYVVTIRNGQATQVDYSGMAADHAQLKKYLTTTSSVKRVTFDSWPREEQLAFLINAYNAWTVELVLTAYPGIDSIKDLGSLFQSPWKKRFIPLLGETRTLDDIEHGLIRGSGRYNEPRIHFAVNCASIGCPALRPEAYIAAQLDEQLEEATRNFLSDRARNRLVGDALNISGIFKWYRGDFEQGWRGATSLSRFLARYRQPLGLDERMADRLSSGNIGIEFLDYDWRLNRKP